MRTGVGFWCCSIQRTTSPNLRIVLRSLCSGVSCTGSLSSENGVNRPTRSRFLSALHLCIFDHVLGTRSFQSSLLKPRCVRVVEVSCDRHDGFVTMSQGMYGLVNGTGKNRCVYTNTDGRPKDYTSKVEITAAEIVTEIVNSISDEETSQHTSTSCRESV